jgi:23S rRNA (cytidine1920-2'-O)/16S rRNA (cytidine1409-2'-O)-methyltransferase
MAARVRLDQALVARGHCASREQARRLILAGEIRIGTRVAAKASELVAPSDPIGVMERPRFVGRGGLKLEAALAGFGIDVHGLVCLDAGASTGGFTDCLLDRGAARVHAFDVGTNQLAWKLRSDPRVRSIERFNCRRLTPGDVGELVDLAVMDLSFISLLLVLPAVVPCVKRGGQIICLIKPQFELSRTQVGKGGIVRDPVERAAAVEKIRRWVAKRPDLEWAGLIDSPITGTDGNQEFLAWIKVTPA